VTADVFGIVGTRQAAVFRVDQVVAEGGFAVVYRAMHEGFRAPVALKCLKVPETLTDEGRTAFLDKFREEGELQFRLSALSSSVVRPLHVDVLTLEGGRMVPFLALEWLDGEGLDRVIERRRAEGLPPMDARSLVALLQPVAAALAQAHRLPTPDGPVAVIHRDLKPENIFVLRASVGGGVKILDFGIARAKSAAGLDAGRVTQSGSLDAFTPGYAAPEQWLPKRYGQVGPWTDVFGLAMSMVEALIGRPPIEGDLAGMMGTTTDPGRRPTPRTEGADVPDAVEAAFARALAVDPRERTQSIDAFWTELEAALGLPPSIQPSGVPTSARSLASAAAAPPPPPQPVSARTPPQAASGAPVARTIEAPRASPPPAAPAAPMSFELAAPVRPRRDATLAPSGLARRGEQERAAGDLRRALRGPVRIAVLGIAIIAADFGYTHVTGEILAPGGVRPLWIAGPIALLGIGLACWRVVTSL